MTTKPEDKDSVSLSGLLFDTEEPEQEDEADLEDVNALGAGGVVGYTAPIGTAAMNKDKKKERGFWQDDANKAVKTASPALHGKK